MRRNIMITGILCLALSTFATAQPALVQKAFEQKFLNATHVNWGNENGTEWQADFLLDGSKFSAVFNPQGTWIETIRMIKLAELPQEVRNSIITKFPSWKITELNKTEKAKSGIIYEVNIKKGRERKNIAFSEDGSIIH